jgi:uncharacterized Zn-finger protein
MVTPKPDATPAGEPALVQPNAENHYHVTPADLPLSCPMPGMYLWNSHPKVYLPIEEDGHAKCPYCGAAYTLTRGR